LADDGEQRSGPKFLVIWYRYGGGSALTPLHDDVASFSADFDEAMALQD
jgi:hypothetical protein